MIKVCLCLYGVWKDSYVAELALLVGMISSTVEGKVASVCWLQAVGAKNVGWYLVRGGGGELA